MATCIKGKSSADVAFTNEAGPPDVVLMAKMLTDKPQINILLSLQYYAESLFRFDHAFIYKPAGNRSNCLYKYFQFFKNDSESYKNGSKKNFEIFRLDCKNDAMNTLKNR